MATRQVGVSWRGPKIDIAAVLIVDAPLPNYGAALEDLDESVVYYRALDANDEATGEIVGIEIDDFLNFDHWSVIPAIGNFWQYDGLEPAPPVTMLKRLQKQLRARADLPRAS